MSDQQPARPGGPDPRRNPFITILLILVGIILLLPGLCSVLVSVVWIRGLPGYRTADFDSTVLLMVLACFAIGAAGVGVIVFAVRR
jgi:hypothetical protein